MMSLSDNTDIGVTAFKRRVESKQFITVAHGWERKARVETYNDPNHWDRSCHGNRNIFSKIYVPLQKCDLEKTRIVL